MARKNKSYFAILGLISKRDMSGYEIKKLIEKMSAFHWAESNAQIYPILKQLEQEGLVSAYDDASSGARKKRVYSVTDMGMQALLKWMPERIELPKYREDLSLKLGYAQHVPITQTIDHVKDYQSQILEKQKQLKEVIQHLTLSHKDRPDYEYLMMIYDLSRRAINAKLEWAEATLKHLHEMEQKSSHGQ